MPEARALLFLAGLLTSGCGARSREVATPAAEEPLPTADALIARAVEAMGSEAAIRAHTSLLMEGEMRMVAQEIVAPMVVMQQAPSTWYSRVELPGVGLMQEGVEGDVAWADDPLSGPRLKEGVEKAQAMRSADPYYLLNLRAHYPTLETLGRAEVEGRPVYELRAVPELGAEEIMLFDVENGLLLGGRMTVENAMGSVTITTLSDDFREVGDLLVPFRTRVMNSLMSIEMRWTRVVFDAPDLVIPPMPDAVRALVPAE